jgi:hypothetical protein
VLEAPRSGSVIRPNEPWNKLLQLLVALLCRGHGHTMPPTRHYIERSYTTLRTVTGEAASDMGVEVFMAILLLCLVTGTTIKCCFAARARQSQRMEQYRNSHSQPTESLGSPRYLYTNPPPENEYEAPPVYSPSPQDDHSRD